MLPAVQTTTKNSVITQICTESFLLHGTTATTEIMVSAYLTDIHTKLHSSQLSMQSWKFTVTPHRQLPPA